MVNMTIACALRWGVASVGIFSSERGSLSVGIFSTRRGSPFMGKIF